MAQRVLDVLVDRRHRPRVDEGRHRRRGVARVTDDEPDGPLDERVEHRVGDVGVQVDPLDRGAQLSGVREGPDRDLLGGPLRVDAGIHDDGVLAAVLGERRRAPGRAGDPHGRPGGAAADVRDEVHARVRRERGSDAGIPLDELEDALGQATRHDLGEPATGLGAALGGLVHGDVAGDEGRREQPGGGGVGVVPRGDDADDPSGLRAHEVDGTRPAGERPPADEARDGRLVEEVGGDAGRGARLAEQPPRRRAEQVAQVVGRTAHLSRRVAQVAGPVGGGRAAPTRRGGPGAAHGVLHGIRAPCAEVLGGAAVHRLLARSGAVGDRAVGRLGHGCLSARSTPAANRPGDAGRRAVREVTGVRSGSRG